MIKQKKELSILLLTILLTITQITAQTSVNGFDKEGKRHGVWQKTYPNTNQLRYKGQFNHGKEIDTFKYYKLKRKKSVLSAIKVFNKANNIADVTFMTSKGKIVSRGKMDGKLFIDKWVFYHNKTNDVMIEEHYNTKGQLSGNRKVYFKNGKVAESIDYKDGEINGESMIFSESGNLLQQSIYSNGKLNGKTVYFDVNGNKEAEGLYKSNIKIGIWSYYKNKILVRKVDHDQNKVVYKQQ